MGEREERVNIFEDCPELFRSAVSIYIKKANRVCQRYQIAGECYESCPLYGKNCGLTRNAADNEINEVIEILENFDEATDKPTVCRCGYIYGNDVDYKFCPYCGAEKP